MSEANNIRKYLELLNERAPDAPIAYKGSKDDPSITYDAESKGGEITKVIARLKSDPSGRYTKLGRNLLRMERINQRINQLKEETKADARELLADLFNADDACRTREVETVSFLFMMTADPKVTETYKYAKIMEELEKSFTPELLAKKNLLMEQFKTETQKAPSIRVARDKAEEGMVEGVISDTWKAIKQACRKIYNHMLAWGREYDAKLDLLKAEYAMGGGAVEEADMGSLDDTTRGNADIKWGELLGKGIARLTKKPERKAADQADQRARNKAFRQQAESIEENGNPLREAVHTPIFYRGYEIGYDMDAAYWGAEPYWYHPEGWEPGDADGETGQPDTRGHYTAASIEDAKEAIDDELQQDQEREDHTVQEDDDWYSQDDFQDYNDAEADDYRNEGGEDDVQTYSAEGAVYMALEMMGRGSSDGSNILPGDRQQVEQLISELKRYSDVYSISPHPEQDNCYEFDCADMDSVNSNYNPMATAWVDENGNFYYEA